MVRLHLLDCSDAMGTADAPPGVWYFELRRCLEQQCDSSTLGEADVVLPDVDTMVPHYPSFLEACSKHPGGRAAFSIERDRRLWHLWNRVLPGVLPRLSPTQRLVLFDVETADSPGSDTVHREKHAAPSCVAHVSLCMDARSYRPNIDVSFPAVLPAALGTDTERARPLSDRPLLLSFCGRRTHAIRKSLFALHNGSDIICIDTTEDRAEAARRGGNGFPPADEQAISLHAASRFALCPRGDAVYSFRMAEALSCGAIPVVIGDGWVLPFSELLDYTEFILGCGESAVEVAGLPGRLRALPDAIVHRLQSAGRRAFEQHFASLEVQARTLLAILERQRRCGVAGRSAHQTTGDVISTHAHGHAIASSTHARALASRMGAQGASPSGATASPAVDEPSSHSEWRTAVPMAAVCYAQRGGACRCGYRRQNAPPQSGSLSRRAASSGVAGA